MTPPHMDKGTKSTDAPYFDLLCVFTQMRANWTTCPTVFFTSSALPASLAIGVSLWVLFKLQTARRLHGNLCFRQTLTPCIGFDPTKTHASTGVACKSIVPSPQPRWDKARTSWNESVESCHYDVNPARAHPAQTGQRT